MCVHVCAAPRSLCQHHQSYTFLAQLLSSDLNSQRTPMLRYTYIRAAGARSIGRDSDTESGHSHAPILTMIYTVVSFFCVYFSGDWR